MDFYFENEFNNETLLQLIANFAQGNFGVRIVPDRSSRELLEGVICHGMTTIDSLPQENVSFYALFDLKKRLAVRRYSYFCNADTLEPSHVAAFNRFRVFLLGCYQPT